MGEAKEMRRLAEQLGKGRKIKAGTEVSTIIAGSERSR